MAPASFTCRYCGKSSVSRSLQGLKSHISQTPTCRARRDEEYALLNRSRSVQTGFQYTQESLEEDGIPPSNNSDEHRSKRARVDDDDDDSNDNNNANTFRPTNVNFIVDYPTENLAGATVEDSPDGLETRFEKIKHAQEHSGEPAWAPFNNLGDWELSHLSLSE